MKCLIEASQEDIIYANTELEKNLYNEYYWSFFGDLSLTKLSLVNDGYGRKYMTIVNDNYDHIGMVSLSRKIPLSNAVLSIFVYEKYSSNGYGTQALEEAIEMCKIIGVDNILIDTTSERLRKYYKKFGFKDVGCFNKWATLPDFKKYDKYYLQLIL